MSMVVGGIDVDRVYVDGIECDSVWVNGIQVIIPPIEIGNQATNGGALFHYRNSNSTAISTGSGSIVSGFDDVIGVAYGYARYTTSSPYYTKPSLSLSSAESLLCSVSGITKGASSGAALGAALLNSNSMSAYFNSAVSQDLINFCALHVSAVGVNNANYFDALCGLSTGGVLYRNKSSMAVEEGDLLLYYGSTAFSWGTAAGISHGLIVNQHPATNSYSPILFEVTSPGVISNAHQFGLFVLVGKR